MDEIFTAKDGLPYTEVVEVLETEDPAVKFANPTDAVAPVDEPELPSTTAVTGDIDDPHDNPGGDKGPPEQKSGGDKGPPQQTSGDDKGPPNSGNDISHNPGDTNGHSNSGNLESMGPPIPTDNQQQKEAHHIHQHNDYYNYPHTPGDQLNTRRENSPTVSPQPQHQQRY